MTALRRILPVIALSVPSAYLLWIVFIGNFSPHDLLVGVVATILAALGMCVVDIQYPARFSPTLEQLLALWRLPWYVISGTWEVLKVAATDLIGVDPAESLFQVAPFNAPSQNGPRDVARRVLAVTYTTMAPNFIILGINARPGLMLYHQIKKSSVPKMTQSLGAQG